MSEYWIVSCGIAIGYFISCTACMLFFAMEFKKMWYILYEFQTQQTEVEEKKELHSIVQFPDGFCCELNKIRFQFKCFQKRFCRMKKCARWILEMNFMSKRLNLYCVRLCFSVVVSASETKRLVRVLSSKYRQHLHRPRRSIVIHSFIRFMLRYAQIYFNRFNWLIDQFALWQIYFMYYYS